MIPHLLSRTLVSRLSLPACLLAALLLFPLPASAAESAPSLFSLEQQIDDFVNGPE